MQYGKMLRSSILYYPFANYVSINKNVCEYHIRFLVDERNQMFVKELKMTTNVFDDIFSYIIFRYCTAHIQSLYLNQSFGNEIMNRLISMKEDEFSIQFKSTLKCVDVSDLDSRSHKIEETVSHVKDLFSKLIKICTHLDTLIFSAKLRKSHYRLDKIFSKREGIIPRRMHVMESEGELKDKPSATDVNILNKNITFDLLNMIQCERKFRIISGSEYIHDHENFIEIKLKPDSFVNLNYINNDHVEYITLSCLDFYCKVDLDIVNIMSTHIDEEESPFNKHNNENKNIMIFASSMDYSISLESWNPYNLKTYKLYDSFVTKFTKQHYFVFSFKKSDIKSKEIRCSLNNIGDVLSNILKFASDLKDSSLKIPLAHNLISY